MNVSYGTKNWKNAWSGRRKNFEMCGSRSKSVENPSNNHICKNCEQKIQFSWLTSQNRNVLLSRINSIMQHLLLLINIKHSWCFTSFLWQSCEIEFIRTPVLDTNCSTTESREMPVCKSTCFMHCNMHEHDKLQGWNKLFWNINKNKQMSI